MRIDEYTEYFHIRTITQDDREVDSLDEALDALDDAIDF